MDRLGGATLVPAEFTAVKSTEHIVTFVLRYRPLGLYPLVENSTPALKNVAGYLQAQGIAPLEAPQQAATSASDATLDEHRPRSEAPASDGPEPEVKVKVKREATREESEISEDTDDDDIRTLLVCNFLLLTLAVRSDPCIRLRLKK